MLLFPYSLTEISIKMYTEVPKLTRCCFCVPLRYGLLVWGYLKLLPLLALFTTLILELKRFLDYQSASETHNNIGVPPSIPILFTIIIVEIIFSIVLLIAGHLKNAILFKVYYYYSIAMAVIFIICYAVFIIGFIVLTYSNPFMYMLLMYVVQIVLFGAAVFVLHIYITILVRSEMLKLRDNSNFSFVNHAAEAQCTMTYGKETV